MKLRKILAVLTAILMLMACVPLGALPVSAATVDYVTDGTYVYNWGTRETVATFLSPMAEAWYEKNNVSYEDLAALKGSSTQSSVPSSPLYLELKSLMTSNHKTITSYNSTRFLYQYTDCQNSGKTSKKISSFYSGKEVGPDWDGGSTWIREHTWPNSKGLAGDDENDIMMLRPIFTSENSSRSNTAYGESSGFYHPNYVSDGKYDLRGDVARIMLYVYCRWGNTGKMWGATGVMESLPVLLKWVTEDPVDTWELGRNDSVQSITGTRNVFVDYPELVFVLFGAEIPADYITPSGKAAEGAFDINATSNNTAYGTVSVSGRVINATPKTGYEVVGYDVLSGSATVAQSGNSFTVTATGDVSIRINFAPRAQVQVQFAQGDSIMVGETVYSGDAITLPDHNGAVSEGVTFIGWVEEALAETTDIPVFYAAGAKYTVDKNVTLHALYSHIKEDGGTNNNLFVPHDGPLVEGDYLIVCDGQAMTGSVNDKTRLDAVAVTMQGDFVLPANNAVWHIAPEGDYWTIYNLETGKYAAGTTVKSSNQATTIASITDYAKWSLTVKSTGYEFTNVGRVALSANPLLRYNTSVSAFACYATNTTVGGPNKLYKRATGTTYYFTGEASAACLTYESVDGEVTITGCDKGVSGDLIIPSIIQGYPVTTIGYGAFSVCTSLTSVTIPDSVTTIGKYAFYYCTSLTSVIIPDSVTTIGELAFDDCTSLTSVTIGDSVVTIGSGAFSGCASLTSVTIPDSVTIIRENAFRDCTALTSVTMGDSVRTIGFRAFYNCTSLQSVTIPDSVTTIGEYAFDNCTSLQSVTIPDSVTTIGEYAFRNCTSLTSFDVGVNNPNYCDVDGVLFNKDKTTLLQYPAGKEGTSYTISDSVTTIGDGAFYNCDSLTSVIIPDSVTTIGKWVFTYCDSLTSVTLPDSVRTIGEYAFIYCAGLTSVTIGDSVRTIGDYAFYDCTSLTSVTMGDSVHTICDGAFNNCTALTDVYYGGTYTNRNAISISSYNDALLNATWHYEYCFHQYSSDCDSTCNECGATRVAPHVYTDACDRDCNLCGVNRVAPHVYDYVCDNTCNLCGAKRKAADHVYGNDCDVDCNICGDDGRVAPHVYTDTCDRDCNECGAFREPPHDYENLYDDTCNTCGEWREVTIVYGDANGDGAITVVDEALLSQYLAGWDATPNAFAADVNGDGVITVVDEALLAQYLAGWDVELG